MKKFNNILLFGGETKNENMPVGFYSSLALLPLRGKPVIRWQLENLKTNGISDFIIAVCSNNIKLIDYIKNVLSANYNIKLVLVNSKKNILSTLKHALMAADINIPTRVILGDTLIPNSIDSEVDVIFTSNDITTSENWCLVDKKLNIFDKEKVDLSDKEALVGYYAFSDTKHLLNCCIKSRLFLKKEISTALIKYREHISLKFRTIDDWYDLGHTAGLIKAKNLLFSARCFNSISTDTNKGLLTKTSTKIQKLEDEAYWFNNIPKDLKIFTPRFVSFTKNDKTASLTQELYGYPSLQELYLSGEVNIEDWRYIIEKLFELHKYFENYKSPHTDSSALKWLYYDKTEERLSELVSQNVYWRRIFDKEEEFINNKPYLGLVKLKNSIRNYAQEMCKNAIETVIHGDYCFSNILFDSSNYIFKLIDPRGRLNAEATIYGDPRYDIAKLRHSVVGLYDFIVHGLFKLKEGVNGFEYKILTTNNYDILEGIFDDCATKCGFKTQEIKFIEGLLFLSMIPLHKDSFDRQKVFYLKALELLNDTVKITNEDMSKWKKKSLEFV